MSDLRLLKPGESNTEPGEPAELGEMPSEIDVQSVAEGIKQMIAGARLAPNAEARLQQLTMALGATVELQMEIAIQLGRHINQQSAVINDHTDRLAITERRLRDARL